MVSVRVLCVDVEHELEPGQPINSDITESDNEKKKLFKSYCKQLTF